MNDIRAKFEEIWPVPDGVMWRESVGKYGCQNYLYEDKMDAWNIRLDTFTRCQETTAIYSGIVDDMIDEMELINDVSTDLRAVGIAREAIGRAKQKMGMMKNGR